MRHLNSFLSYGGPPSLFQFQKSHMPRNWMTSRSVDLIPFLVKNMERVVCREEWVIPAWPSRLVHALVHRLSIRLQYISTTPAITSPDSRGQRLTSSVAEGISLGQAAEGHPGRHTLEQPLIQESHEDVFCPQYYSLSAPVKSRQIFPVVPCR